MKRICIYTFAIKYFSVIISSHGQVMAETPQAALKEAKRQSNLSVNPKYTVTWHGFLNIGEVGTAMVALVAVMLSSNETTAAELMVVSSFAYGYVSIMMLAGGIVSPYTQALLPLSLYFLLYHLIGSGFLLLSGGWLMGVANGEFLMQVACCECVRGGIVMFCA
ncbi:hypothetical protein HPB51_015130 [Rhipicephalus microplus]|uniref:Uncharacterized protein n=1 Tax=Rhipicephalus microplus TaxID=6941 RepID=A0A9J6DP83_RHIMP|nr:hypothetical protein HPB51_015130 [Rhipicephalus microplus]